ncbi:hypothetical protein SDC9_58710 [bioreactor metagenome]|uniref:Uncharacterized protein n=1 Tax=bioreactor metagenome TaxID=1076179 RepID=A0A644X8V8_9ZZZZ
MTDSPGEIAFHDRRKEFPAPGDPVGESSELFHVLFHESGPVAAPEDVHILVEQLHSRIFLVHGRDHGNAVLFLHGLADLTAGCPVPACVKGRAGDKDIELHALEHRQDAGQGLVRAGRHEIVAADDGVGHFHVLREAVENLGAPDSSGADFRLVVGHVLAADLPEKLVDVMNRLEHYAFSPS